MNYLKNNCKEIFNKKDKRQKEKKTKEKIYFENAIEIGDFDE